MKNFTMTFSLDVTLYKNFECFWYYVHHFPPLLFIDILHLYKDVDPVKSGRASRTVVKIQLYPLLGTGRSVFR